MLWQKKKVRACVILLGLLNFVCYLPFRLVIKTRHVFVKHGCPWRQQSQNMAKISKSFILTPPHPQGHVVSVKCEEPIDELTVQV